MKYTFHNNPGFGIMICENEKVILNINFHKDCRITYVHRSDLMKMGFEKTTNKPSQFTLINIITPILKSLAMPDLDFKKIELIMVTYIACNYFHIMKRLNRNVRVSNRKIKTERLRTSVTKMLAASPSIYPLKIVI